MREVGSFSKWMWVAAIGSIIAAQGDVILLGRLVGPAAVGVYSVALALAMRLDALNQSVLTVMLPRASRLSGPGEMRGYAKRALGGSLALAGALGLVAVAAQPLITWLYGDRYAASAGLFLALLPVVLFDLATSSLFLLALPLNRPRVLAAADWLRVAVLGAACWLLIPAYRGYGAAAARLLSRIAGAAYTGYALRRAVLATSAEVAEDEIAATRWAS
jgi:O-antigen/teichoic acid export membrane protein